MYWRQVCTYSMYSDLQSWQCVIYIWFLKNISRALHKTFSYFFTDVFRKFFFFIEMAFSEVKILFSWKRWYLVPKNLRITFWLKKWKFFFSKKVYNFSFFGVHFVTKVLCIQSLAFFKYPKWPIERRKIHLSERPVMKFLDTKTSRKISKNSSKSFADPKQNDGQ